MVLLFAAALGMAIPGAPSGIGTFHAAVVSAFVVLGRPASEGLVLAVAAHGVFFIGYCASAALALTTVRYWNCSHAVKIVKTSSDSVIPRNGKDQSS